MWHVYILKTKKGQLYTGVTNNLERRMKAHQDGKGARFTRSFGVDRIVYSQRFRSRSKALQREAQIKSWSREQKLALINS
jgi:putative endonuclease